MKVVAEDFDFDLESVVSDLRGDYRTSSLEDRAVDYAVQAIELFRILYRKEPAARHLARQFLSAATSIGANVAEGQAAVSRADFANKYGIARKEARECLYWLTLFRRSGFASSDAIEPLRNETDQLVAILTSIVKKVKPRET